MAYEEKNAVTEVPSNVVLENRSRLSVSGVEDVESFDEGLVVVNTSRGTLIVRGSELRMEKLSLDSGDIAVEGTIDGFEYETDTSSKEGFFTKLFR